VRPSLGTEACTARARCRADGLLTVDRDARNACAAT
jgi:hypothetical protein